MASLKELAHLQIPFKDIKSATNDFSNANFIGGGEFGKVYKARLLKSTDSNQWINVVVRRLNSEHGQGGFEFLTEILTLSRFKHENLVSVLGFCDKDGENIIVYKHEVHGSLDKRLGDRTLTWLQRLKICVGAARALSYIHYDVNRNYGVIHRDIKSSNILLDDRWEAKISGFRVSIVNMTTRKHRLLISKVCGTPGYQDPVYVTTGGVTDKSDVYSFGIVLFEVLCGRLSVIESSQQGEQYLSQLVKLRYEEGKLDEIIDLDLRKQMEPQSFSVFSDAAYHCLKEQRAQRPDMDQIVQRLENALAFQLKHENLENPTALEVKATSSSNRKVKNLEHLKVSLRDIKLATGDFDTKNQIGGGGYGKVYRAKLNHFDSTVSSKGMTNIELSSLPKKSSSVAIKRLVRSESGQGENEFLAEIEILTSCKHRNIVSLLGFCYEDPEMMLVYEFSCNGSLDKYLGSNTSMNNLTWEKRVQICLDVAHALDYLHTMGEKHRIIHRDVKSANILLGENWEAKIADFGLSRIGPANQLVTYVRTNVAGTNVYCDPEYQRTNVLTKESDVYSFGVVLFEVLCGRLAYDPIYFTNNEQGLPSKARRCFKERKLHEIIDPRIKGETDETFFTPNKGADEDSLHTFSTIAYQCLAETQAERPTMEVVITKLKETLNFQVNRKNALRISLKDIKLATENFDDKNLIGKGGFGDIYKGEVLQLDRCSTIVVKRHVAGRGQDEHEFLMELEILFDYKHRNIIGLVGYCNEMNEKIIVYEHASHGSLDRHLKDASLTWTQRLKICIDVARGLDFLHGDVGSQQRVIHRDIKSSNILLNHDWESKISGFGLSIVTPIVQQMDYVIGNATGTIGYSDPQYVESGVLSKESDIYSFGVVLLEVLCGIFAFELYDDERHFLRKLVKHPFEEGKVDEMVFQGIKAQMVPKSLSIFSTIASQCLHCEVKERPTTSEVLIQLTKSLEFQEDYEIWEPKLPRDYEKIIQLSKSPVIYSAQKKKDLHDMLSNGILLQEGKVWFSLSVDGERNEMISAKTFSYKNGKSHKWKSTKKSRFHTVAKMVDISNLKIQIYIKTQFLSPGVTYGAHLIFKFCDPRKFSTKPMYVNLKYKMGRKTLHTYFATRRDDEWMMIELRRFLNHKKATRFKVQLESFSRYYCGSGAIYVEGLEFRPIDNVKREENEKLEDVQSVLMSNTNKDGAQQLPTDEGEKSFLLSKVNGKKCHMLPAKMALYDSSKARCFTWKHSAQSRVEVVELLGHQVFHVKCKIERKTFSHDTKYVCYLVFKISEKCRGLQCPVKVRDLLRGKNKETKIFYFRSPSLLNLHDINWVPQHRKDGWMEVIVWEFNSTYELDNDHLPMDLKLISYEGTMSGLILCSLEFRPM